MGLSMKNQIQKNTLVSCRKWVAGIGIMMALAGCSSTHKTFNRGPYLAYGLGQNAAYVPIEPYIAAENIRRSLVCNARRTKPFMRHDLQEERFIITNAILPGSQTPYEIIVAWSFTGTLLRVTAKDPVPAVISTISDYAKQGANCAAVAVRKT